MQSSIILIFSVIIPICIAFYFIQKQKSFKTKIQDLEIKSQQFEIQTEKFKNLSAIAIEAHDMGLWHWNIVSDYLEWDDKSFRIYDVDKDKFTPTIEFWKSLILSEDKNNTESDLQRCLKQERFFFSKFRILDKNKKIRYIKVNAQVVRNEKDVAFEVIGVCTDITSYEELRVRLEDIQLKQMQTSKLISLGEMTAGISHEINNPLAIMSAKSWMVKDLLQKEPLNLQLISECNDKISDQVGRIAKIIKGLKNFSRDASHDPFEICSIQTIIHDSIALCADRFKKENVALFFDIPKETISAQCIGIQVSQVLVNLLGNAFDASKTASFAWVRMNVKLNKGANPLNSFVEIRISDSGQGVSEENEKNIMKPFFTTKPPGKGTGLGLSISMKIALDHKGKLYLDRQESDSCFCLSIPLRQPAIEEKMAS
ncbi:MAG: sensor histidine kinase [Pseudobdellovibrionaceae bacterium]